MPIALFGKGFLSLNVIKTLNLIKLAISSVTEPTNKNHEQ
jgi:hypothetical protein